MQDLTKPTEKTPINDTPFSFGQTDEIEVDLASPWARMGAALLNSVFFVLTYIPFLGTLFTVFGNPDASALIPLTLLIPLVYGIWQLVQYSRHGQTLGKKIVGIRVIREDGSNPGFMGVVLREGVYNIILLAITLLIALPLGLTSKNVINIYDWILMFASLICVVMLFAVPDRRTLQDMLAKTVVIQLPKDHSR
ncbi:RDD family protein [Conchiformibius steedae DSM 2580]|uniref:RDD family protein n=1 Tax=Conchiformibius steedae DSM 2580 TaxID=1121352 RepID=A0AAE9HUF9_9NEIS|nr:RDD family protein [Conchiformibius steedae]QMT34084.1 RDD family protein [Conchiformibius steedae]URD66858.1 RDD family protein [Conchiformibius steedae DSM 2580]